MDATYTYTGDYNKVGNTNALKDFLVKKGGETGEILFGDEKLGEKMGSWAYTGLDVVSFLNGVDKLGKSFGKLQTITSGTAETSKVWGEIHMDDVIDNDLKYLSKDGIIKTILHIDPNSVANFGYDVVTGTIKSIWREMKKPTIISQFPIRRVISIRKPCFSLCRRISKMYLS